VILKGEDTATTSSTTAPMVERGEKEDQEEPASLVLAGGAEEGKEMARAIHNALALLEGIFREAPAPGIKRVA